jgi:hypothetical protein
MKSLLLLSLISMLVSCGGMLLENKQVRAPASVAPIVTEELRDEELYLRILEKKYADHPLRRAIVRGMLVEIHDKHPNLVPLDRSVDLKELHKNPRFLALELTVEHLAHRESVKLSMRHSAFHHSL